MELKNFFSSDTIMKELIKFYQIKLKHAILFLEIETDIGDFL